MTNSIKLPDIDQVLESGDNWLEYEPKTELGKLFYKWSQSNLPRHMGAEDWNRPWAVVHTQALEILLAQKDLERAEAVENALRKSSPGREMYQLGLKDGAKEERERLEKRFDDLEFISSFQKKQLKEDIFEAIKETKAVK